MPRDPDFSTLAARLVYARKKRGLTQMQLAAAAKLKQPDISKLELGKMHKTTGMARLVAALNVPAEWLEDGAGDEPHWNPGEPRNPKGNFDDSNRQPSASEWALLDALKWLPENEVEEIRQDVIDKAAKYEEFVEKQMDKINRREIEPRRARDNLGGISTGFGELPADDEESGDG